VKRRPLHNECMCATRELTSDHVQRVNSVYGFNGAILSMEVRWRMIVEIHLYHDAKELTELRHSAHPHALATLQALSRRTTSTYACIAMSCEVPLSLAQASYFDLPTTSKPLGRLPVTSPTVACL
jgi:hypothetical protein